MQVFRTSLLFCVWMFPQHANLQIDKDTLDSFYKFLYGPSIAGRTPSPSLRTLMITERKAWRQIALELQEGLALKEAAIKVQGDYLFWQREVYERCSLTISQYGNNTGSKGKGRGKPYMTIYTGRKGKAKGKGKGSKSRPWQQGKSQPWEYKRQDHQYQGERSQDHQRTQDSPSKAHWNKNWAHQDSNKKQFCKNHILHDSCAGGCGRSHQCPVLKKNNQPCNESHHPNQCPHNR